MKIGRASGSVAVATHEASGDPHTGYRLESADHTHQSTGLQGGTLADAALAAGAAGSAHTPTITQSGTVTSLTANTLSVITTGKRVKMIGRLTINNAGGATAANAISVTLPANARNTTDMIGVAKLYDASADTTFPAWCFLTAAGTFQMMPVDTSFILGAAFSLGNKTFTAALATGDIIDVEIDYEKA